jgi:transposase
MTFFLRTGLTEHGAVDSTIPRKGYQTLDEQPQPFDRQNYAKRHLIENFFQRMKAHKRLALRSEKTASSFALRRIHHFRGTPGQNSPRLICEDTA